MNGSLSVILEHMTKEELAEEVAKLREENAELRQSSLPVSTVVLVPDALEEWSSVGKSCQSDVVCEGDQRYSHVGDVDQDGLACGAGICTYHERGFRYEGQFRRGKRHGKGKMKFFKYDLATNDIINGHDEAAGTSSDPDAYLFEKVLVCEFEDNDLVNDSATVAEDRSLNLGEIQTPQKKQQQQQQQQQQLDPRLPTHDSSQQPAINPDPEQQQIPEQRKPQPNSGSMEQQRTTLPDVSRGGWQSNADLPHRRKVAFRLLSRVMEVIHQMSRY